MNEQLPYPLVPMGVDLRDFWYLPLDALRLRDSELAIEASPGKTGDLMRYDVRLMVDTGGAMDASLAALKNPAA